MLKPEESKHQYTDKKRTCNIVTHGYKREKETVKMVTRVSIRCVGIFLICFTITNFVQLVISTSNEVTTELGKITGSIEDVLVYDENGDPTTMRYVQYLGIPYAEPPTDDRRFRKPVAKTPWSIPHNGTFHRPMCIQSPTILTGPIAIKDGDMSENCLTLDIYAPIGTITNEGPYPVLMFLFGASGGSQGFVGDALSAYGDVIVVVINTRTEMIGYFSTGDEAAPGNFGLWDEKMALHWVHDHISNFDGDKNRISLAGFSMGGSNAILQALHPANKDIIKGVIALGGTPFPTHKSSNFVKKPNGMEFIESVGCKSGSSKKIVECMRKKSLSDLYAGLGSLPYSLSFTPVVDGDFVIAEPYTILTGTDSNLTAAKEAFGSVNLMSGLSNMEGGVHIVLMWSNILNIPPNAFGLNKTEFADSVVPTAMDIIFGKNVPDAVIQNVVYQYSDLTDPENVIKLRQSVVDLSTDIDVATPILKTTKFHHDISTKKTYLYQFSANLSLDTVLTPTWLEGANHGTEVHFVLGLSERNMQAWTHSAGHVPTLLERTTSAKMMRLISNFVKSG